VGRWALSVALAFSAAGCTRLNGAFIDAGPETDGSGSGLEPTETTETTGGMTGDPTRDSEDGSASAGTTIDPTVVPTVDPTHTSTSGGSTTEADFCLAVYGADGGCDPYAMGSCRNGDCRPYGTYEELTGIACVEQPSGVEEVLLGDECEHECGGLLGSDGCPAASLCDPFSEEPICLQLCDPDGNADCGPGSSCFLYAAGPDTFGLCRTGCNPLNEPSGCPNGQNCVASKGGFDCQPALDNPAGPGAPCAALNECNATLMCSAFDSLDCGGAGCCTPYCSVALDDCGMGQHCHELDLGVGFCAPPE